MNNAMKSVRIARKIDRPNTREFIDKLFENFMEMHGDRLFADDGSIVGGIASFEGTPVTVIGIQKGHTLDENVECNFGSPNPEGYRKALRLMKQAEKFHRPVITLVNTAGAFCGIGAEERGQGEAIARNIMEMSRLKTPIISIFTGEGGSGGALAMATSDEVWMLENSIYSILSPEGFATILWKDSTKAKEAAEVMKLTASDLKDLGMIEQIIPEKEPLTRENMMETMEVLEKRVRGFLDTYCAYDLEKLLNKRYNRFRNL